MPIKTDREYRDMQMRALPEGKIVSGYASTFNQPYLLYDFGDYRVEEQIDRRAFDECDMSDVIMQYNHEGRVFARNKNGTLQLATDDEGLKVTADLSGTEIGRQLYEEIKGGYTDKMSFGFRVGEDTRTETYDSERNKTTVLRTITKITKLFDVSAVSIPANDATSISARAYSDGLVEELKAERLAAQEKEQKIAKLKEILNNLEVTHDD